LIAAVLFVVVAYSVPAYGVNGNVSVAAKANPKIELNVGTPNVDLGNVDPDVVSGAQAAQVQVKSNKPYDYTYSATGIDWSDGVDSGTTAIGQLRYDGTPFAANGTLSLAESRGTDNWSYNYTMLLIDYDVAADADLSATVTYDAVQNP